MGAADFSRPGLLTSVRCNCALNRAFGADRVYLTGVGPVPVPREARYTSKKTYPGVKTITLGLASP